MGEYCNYCRVIFSTEAELVAHCNSENHQRTIMSDEGHEWKYRAPPRGVGADQYTLCVSYRLRGVCRFNKLCCDAHGEEELSEWRERFDYRQKKLLTAKERKLQGRHYTEQLLDRWLSSTNPNSIMVESLDTVDISFEPELNMTVSEKNCCREWIFNVSAKATLRHVALLYETHRFHFRISQLRASDMKEYSLGPQCQEWSNADGNTYTDESYTIKVKFITSIYGTFRQDIVFDFGFEPVLVKKLCVDVVSLGDMEKLQQARETVVSFTERWSSNDVCIVPFENRPHPPGELEKSLLSRYPAPNGKFNVTNSVMEPTLTKENYRARQHELLCIEEMTQYELLSRYNIQATLKMSSCYLLTPNSAVTAKYAHNGELFANMTLSSVLSEDSASGRLILSNCSTVLLAPVSTKSEEHRKVYEAVIEDKGKTVIYMRLSKKCCDDLKLNPDREFLAEVQFQLNRLPLCEMHFAVDKLHPPSLIFPDIKEIPHLWDNVPLNQKLQQLEPKLNPNQKEAVLAITTPLNTRLPPVLIIGPFGTGKTFTLAQAVKIILDDPKSRILVCTHSNSAADIYIREYLHPQVAEGRIEATPLRIYYRHRWVATVHPTVQQYCLIKSENNERHFVMPTIDDVKNHKVIVTTLSTSRYLVQLGLEKGFFTHILIDEAAQAMECEAIMPLSLADEDTRIVLAGDHMQLCPEVYSPFAQERNLHTSLLERLYDLYPEIFLCKVLLCENYRSHEAIVQYTSELFYNNHLQASGQQPRHQKYYPLTFFTARGEDVQDCNSTAFHNNAEVYELVERVSEIKNNWPDEWGVQDESSIGVVAPYYDQVVRIRAELRKKKMHGVSVERVLNVQGKQFRVIFLSVVRTRQTCGTKAKPESDLDHGFLSNARLLNTAITRAQSLVCVVGDPVSLSSVGKCRKLWEKYIYICHNQSSLFGITWDSLRSQLDSMELKKNFILNPLAPEFIPGRIYHGYPIVTSSDNFYANNPPPQPYLVFSPLPSHFQGPPLIQPAMTMMSPPHPYGMLNNVPNCVVPPLLSPAQLNPFQGYPFNSGPLATSLPQQRPTNLPNRMPPAAFPRKIISSRNPPLMEHNSPLKDFEHNIGIGRQIKRSEPQIPYQMVNKSISRAAEERNIEVEEYNRHLVCNTENHINGFQNKTTEFENPASLQGFPNVYNYEKVNKFSNMAKSEDIPNTPLRNGLISDELNLLPEQLRKLQMNGVWSSPKTRSELETHGNNLNSFEDHSVRIPFGELNGVTIERERHMFETPNAHMFMPPPTADKWPNTESLQNNNASDIPVVNIPMVHTSLMEKLNVLQKLLPPGTNILQFLENDDQIKSFMQRLLSSEGFNSAKSFLLMLYSIRKDQDILQEVHQRKIGNLRYQSPHNVPDMPPPILRNVPAFHSPRPVMNNVPRQQDSFNNSDSLGPEASFSPFSFPQIFSINKSDSVFNNGDRNRQELPKSHPVSSNFTTSWVPDISGNISNGNCNNDPPIFDMGKMAIRNQVPNKTPNGDVQEDVFSSSPFQNRHFGEAANENLRNIFTVAEPQPPPQFTEANHDMRILCSLPDGGSLQNSYLSRLRNLPSYTGSNNHEFDFQKVDDGLVSKPSESPGVITAGPLSMSYPDIPDILSHICPISKESKVIRKPTPRPPENSSSPFLFGINLQSNNESSLRYPQISSEEMTYAKILRSPQQ